VLWVVELGSAFAVWRKWGSGEGMEGAGGKTYRDWCWCGEVVDGGVAWRR